MTTLADIVTLRRQQVVNYSMTELMLLLVFMALTIGFLANEKVKEPSLAAANLRIERLEKELRLAELQRTAALARVAELERRLKELGVDATTLRPATDFNLKGLTSQQLVDYVSVLKRMVDQDQKRIVELEKALKGGKAPGLPICSITSGSLLSFVLLEDGRIIGLPAWDNGAAPIVAKINGVDTLSSGQAISLAEFRNAARQIEVWSTTQNPKCRFVVSYRRLTTNAAIYDEQLSALGYFYLRRVAQDE